MMKNWSVINISSFVPLNSLTIQSFTGWNSASPIRVECQDQGKAESKGYTVFETYETDYKEEQKEWKQVDIFNKGVR